MLWFTFLFILPLFLAAELAASSFVCAGFSFPEVASVRVTKPVYPPSQPLSKSGIKALVVFAQFQDEAPTNPYAPPYADDLFDPELPGSLSHFYRIMSFGQFQFQGTVLPRRYRSDRPATDYLATAPGERGKAA